MISQCKAINKRSGKRCRNRSAPGAKGFCRTHYKSQTNRKRTATLANIKDKALVVSAVAGAANVVLELIEAVSTALSAYAGIFFKTGIPYDFRDPSKRGTEKENMELLRNSPHGLLRNRDKGHHFNKGSGDTLRNQERDDELAIEAWKNDMSLLRSKAAALVSADADMVPTKALEGWHETRNLLNMWLSFVPNWTLELETVKTTHSATKELSKSLDDLIARYSRGRK